MTFTKMQPAFKTVPMQDPKKLPIRQRIMSRKEMKPGPKTLLVEVCQLHENNGCYASNSRLRDSLGCSDRTLHYWLGYLVEQGLIEIDIDSENNNQRTITPTEKTRVLYTGKDKAAPLSITKFAVVKSTAKIAVPTAKNEASTAKNGSEVLQKIDTSTAKNGRAYIENSNKHQLEQQEQQIPAATATAPKDYPKEFHSAGIDAYQKFYFDRVGVKARMLNKDHAALKKLLIHLRKVCNTKDDAGAIGSFKYILSNWHKIEPFLQNQIDLTNIDSNINKILNQLKNGNGKQQNAQANSAGLASDAIAILRAARGGGGE